MHLEHTTPAKVADDTRAAMRLTSLASLPAPGKSPVEHVTHTVLPGETLGGIAERHRQYKPAEMDLAIWTQTIQLLNGLPDASMIKVGQVLRIPRLAPPPAVQNLTEIRPDAGFEPVGDLGFDVPPTIDPPTCPVPGVTEPPAVIPTPLPEPVVLTMARDSLGTRYVWGGTSLSTGTDCSGLTQAVFERNGVALPRTSQAQFATKAGEPVARGDLQAGDLVFFKNSKGKVIHVGIYSGLDADNKQTFISATNTKGVAEYGIDHWIKVTRQHYAGARRFPAE